ncbi:helix-turn-helix transcriptional regulator [Streptomyces sp. NPDC046465]|uniref:helix-turn-helix domain-containing protein n=1 Tax=Streptomyces sp. NPDC046465 TaxID=3155810 RepID=UPI0033CA4155
MSVQYNPTWRYSGNQLKRWRMKANVTREELGAAANYAPDTIKAMEQGVRMPTARVLDVADELCGAEGLLSAAKEYLQREKFPQRVQDFMDREQEALSLWSYEVALIPGLLQTEAYARALLGNRCPPVGEETVEERVSARLERQSILSRKPPVAISFVIYEAALNAAQVDKAQLVRLLEASDLYNVSLQVLPYKRATSSALSGPMVLLETLEHERLALSEGQSVSQLTSDPDVVTAQSERLSMIRTVALSPAESAQFIERMVGDL